MRARALRAHSTDAERLLWHHLRNRQLADCKFRRQHPVGAFIADFACIEAALIVELDGGQHFEPAGLVRDERRTETLRRAGFSVLRFDNRAALHETETVLTSILQWLRLHHPHPNPLPQAGEGVEHPPLPQAGEGVEHPPLPQAREGARNDTKEVS